MFLHVPLNSDLPLILDFLDLVQEQIVSGMTTEGVCGCEVDGVGGGIGGLKILDNGQTCVPLPSLPSPPSHYGWGSKIFPLLATDLVY